MSDQPEFDFTGASGGSQSFSSDRDPWRAHRLREIEEICRKTGVPVGRKAEVCLSQGPAIRGVIRFAEDLLWNDAKRDEITLRIGEVTFTLGEIESVVCIDETAPP